MIIDTMLTIVRYGTYLFFYLTHAASILQILINRINIFYDPYDACVMAYVCLMQ